MGHRPSRPLGGTVSVIKTATGVVSAPITVGKGPEVGGDLPGAERPPTLMMTVPAAAPTLTLGAR
jgi:hypothetical protein